MKRKIFFLLTLLCCGLLLAACGGTEPVVEESADSAPALSEEPAAVATNAPAATPTLHAELAGSAPPPATEAPPVAADEDEATAEAPTAAPTVAPTATPVPRVPVNGVAAEQIVLLDDATRDNVRAVYARGQELGRNPRAFATLGDSLIATDQSIAKWDSGAYTLGEYAFLQPTIDHYAGSFSNYGASVRVGLHSWSVFDPLWADKELCEANEDVLACTIRRNNPSVLLIFLGSNDAGSPGGFNVNMRQIVETAAEQGVVPVLATKADRFEGEDNVNNEMIRQIAAEYHLPLIDFDTLANTLPGRGLGPDNVHLTYNDNPDYTNPETFQIGYSVHNLAVLMGLDEVRRAVAP